MVLVVVVIACGATLIDRAIDNTLEVQMTSSLIGSFIRGEGNQTWRCFQHRACNNTANYRESDVPYINLVAVTNGKSHALVGRSICSSSCECKVPIKDRDIVSVEILENSHIIFLKERQLLVNIQPAILMYHL